MKQARVALAADGSLVVPAAFRAALGLQAGDPVLLRLEDGAMRLIGQRQAIKRAQELARRYVPAGRSLVDELIAERHAQAERE